MKITLVRHGQTDFNYENKMQGCTNNSLNEEGRRECRKLRESLLDKHFDICYMSPLFRAVETAIILIGERVETVVDKRLIERDIGEFEGKNRDLYDPKKYWDYQLNSSDNGVESVQNVFKRCESFLNYLMEKHSGEDILIVTHGSPVRAIHHLLKGTNLATGNLLDIKIGNCYCEEIEIPDK